MAIFKEMRLVRPSSSKAFDRRFGLGADAPYEGIYRCTGCGLELALKSGRLFPNVEHPSGCRGAEWQLVVATSRPGTAHT
ncbi:MAG: hypothetical protein KJ901_25025 [Gammaproteobacteria bacterium]|nr:hypothetical protein [Gammaproteobacteria bacterium]MBU1444421.1 hypothetical protein [Gammaproteobacteria bacterium]